MIKLLYEYGKAKNYSMRELNKDIWDHLKFQQTKLVNWNLYEQFLKFLEEKLELNLVEALEDDIDPNNISLTSNEWHYLLASSKRFYKFMDNPSLYDWSTTNVGTLLIKILQILYKLVDNDYNYKMQNFRSYVSYGFKDVHQLFTIPGQQMSLIDIAYLYSMKDLTMTSELHTPFGYEIWKMKEIPELESYFKRVRIGIPIEKVKLEMSLKNLNPDWLDDPEAEAPPELVPKSNNDKKIYS